MAEYLAEKMNLYDVQANKLDAFIAEYLQPSEEFCKNVQEAVNRICKFLKERCRMDARVIKTVKGGSAGKGTTLEDNSDADLVVFLNCFFSFQDQADKRERIIYTIEQNLKLCCQSVAFSVTIQPPKKKGKPPRSLTLTLQSKRKSEAVEVDILPAYDVLGQITHDSKPPEWVYVNLIETKGEPGEFCTCFTELQRNFVKHRPPKFKGLLRLVKHWYKEYKKKLKQTDPSSKLPSKYALELLTVYAWQEGTKEAEQFNTAEGFCTVMNLLLQYQDLCIYWTKYYDFKNSIIEAYVKKRLGEKRPVIMDPSDPTGNTAMGKGWNLLAEEARLCLTWACCKNKNEPVKSWDVQPARAIQVTVQDGRTRASLAKLTGSPYTAIQKIKESMGSKCCIPVSEMALTLQKPDSGTIDLQNEQTLASYGLFYDTTLLLKAQEMKINVRDYNSRSLVYTVSPNETVMDLKRKIEKRTGVVANQQRLTYNDQELDDTRMLASYKISSQDTVYLLLRLRGGHPSF
ncbi:2'-5'-oligoadenylate synthase 1-like [Varanus komodoensis]|uniref:Ubiquitin-like domain-containing protein n=1 Tax=Varanus komodoensis TaxID=61221 RepID=A0A8D2LF31_VARKO|nr:2'-5'-oligoadenylate synthase 1-like [Varanus komodoensis]